MSAASSRLAGQYLVALRSHLAQSPQAGPAPASKLGRQAVRLGLGTLDLARIHEEALVTLMAPGHPAGDGAEMVQRAGAFFRQALTPVATTGSAVAHGAVGEALLGPRAPEQADARQRLRRETVRRQAAEAALERSREHYGTLLAQSRLMQAQMRRLSHRILLAQEEERRQISRELHDEISQILTGINVRLAALRLEAMANTGGLKRKIASAQRLVEKSVAAVHQFARELRPALLDDLGLVPALLSYAKDFGTRTGLRIRFTASPVASIERLSSLRRTVLYRVAQEALTNVAKHAEATLVKVSIEAHPGILCMEIRDNGKSFDVAKALGAGRSRRLGLLGMRERAEMIGGDFAVESAPGEGTAVRVQIPVRKGAGK